MVEQSSHTRTVAGSNPATSSLGRVAQLGEHLVCTQEVVGSIPIRSIAGRWRNPVAHLTFNQGVPGSIPGRPMCPRSSVEPEHLATDQGVEGSNPSAGLKRVVSSVESEHGASIPGVEGSNPSRPVDKGRLAQLVESTCLTSKRSQVRFLYCPFRGCGSKVEQLLAEQQERVRFSSSACYAGSGRVPMSLEWTERIVGFSGVPVRHAEFKSPPPGPFCGHSSCW